MKLTTKIHKIEINKEAGFVFIHHDLGISCETGVEVVFIGEKKEEPTDALRQE